jgi:hypothetical protein
MVKLREFQKFDPHEYDHLPPRDRLGDYICYRPDHKIVAELMSTPNGERVWEVQCRSCFHTYCLTDGQISKLGAQPCRCSKRSGR